MVVLFARKCRGLVDGADGQCGATRFMTVALMPVVPLAGMWLFNPVTGAGHDMKLSARSMIAAYGRAWGPLVAVASAIVGGGSGFAVAAASSVLTAWTWSWRLLLDKGKRRRLAMNQLALGTGCEPVRMTAEYADTVRASVDDNWRSHGTGGSPGDVARFGSDDLRCTAAAYGVLRMAALGQPADKRAELEADATRILRDQRELPSGNVDHPYRAHVGPVNARVALRPKPVPTRPTAEIAELPTPRSSSSRRNGYPSSCVICCGRSGTYPSSSTPRSSTSRSIRSS